MMWRQGRRRGCKVREKRKGGRERQAGDGDGAVILTEQIMDNGDSPDKAPRQRAWGKDSDNRETVLPQAAAGAARRG